ncbi:TPA: hypothetical protein ACK3RK_005118 [Burkholderia cepacia]
MIAPFDRRLKIEPGRGATALPPARSAVAMDAIDRRGTHVRGQRPHAIFTQDHFCDIILFINR